MRANAKTRVFLDGNVIFSGLYSPEGAPGVILKRFIEGTIEVVISKQVLHEVVRTMKEKLPRGLPALRALLLNATPEIIDDAAEEEVECWAKMVHEEDAGILAAAVIAKPDFLVTGDRHLLENQDVAKEVRFQIVSPNGFIELI